MMRPEKTCHAVDHINVLQILIGYIKCSLARGLHRPHQCQLKILNFLEVFGKFNGVKLDLARLGMLGVSEFPLIGLLRDFPADKTVYRIAGQNDLATAVI